MESSDIFTNTLRSALDTLDTLAAVKKGGAKLGKLGVHAFTNKYRRLRRRLRSHLKFSGLCPERMRMLMRVQARKLIKTYSERDVMRACDACIREGIEGWRIRAVFEEIYDRERAYELKRSA